MRREPGTCSKRWLERECRRGTVRWRPCYRCGAYDYVPQHLFGVEVLCDRCCNPEQDAKATEAAAEWRRMHSLSPLIEELLERAE